MWWKRNRKGEGKEPTPSAPAVAGPARFLDPEVLARINSLELLAKAVVEGFVSGLHRSPFTGFSTEFAEYRQYNPGDDLRYLDWRLLGRTDRYFIKKYRADTNAQFHLLVDTSASMRYAEAGRVPKLQYAKFLAAALSNLVARQQDAVGLVAFDTSIHTHVPARQRTGHMQTVYGQLERLTAGGETCLSEMLHAAAERLTRRGIVALVSDFYDEPGKLAEAFRHLRHRGHDIIAFHVLDPNEVGFDFDDAVLVLEDAETAEEMPVLPDVIARGYRERIASHLSAVRECATLSGVDYELLTTDRPLDFALFSFLSRRAGK